MTCKECIHHKICRIVYYNGDDRVLENSPCEYFKNKADLVEVHCKCSECKEWKPNVGVVSEPDGHCCYLGTQMNAYDFCSYGERR